MKERNKNDVNQYDAIKYKEDLMLHEKLLFIKEEELISKAEVLNKRELILHLFEEENETAPCDSYSGELPNFQVSVNKAAELTQRES